MIFNSDGFEFLGERSMASSNPFPKVSDNGNGVKTALAVRAFLKKSRLDFVINIIALFKYEKCLFTRCVLVEIP